MAGAVRVFEASGEVGGVWSSNRYPGCACDVPAQLYTFSFAQKPWTKPFASQPGKAPRHSILYLKTIFIRYDKLIQHRRARPNFL